MTIPPNESLPSSHSVKEPPLVHRLELAISYLLRAGVFLSITLVVIGTCLTYVHHPEYATASRPLNQIPLVAKDFPHTVADTWRSLMELRGQGFILLGLLVLLVTPVMRVAVSIVAFAIQKDMIFTAVTIIVLSVLILSFFLGKAGG